ncbi:MAG: hypothetical protein JJV98_12740 [Desulfosarcina sp.]|nr:hypothetical protein [Desulfobacterales bacterium]
MRKRIACTGFILVLIAILMLAACASNSTLIGKWQRVADPDTLEFRVDGTFAVVDNMGATATGQYTRHADGTLYYAVTHTNIMRAGMRPVETLEVRTARVTVRRNELELTFRSADQPAVETYRRHR